VSIVVPTYNRGEALLTCINSLFALSYPADRYEVVIVNDGSSDDTEKVLRSCEKNAKCAYKWFTQKNAGIAGARNTGIKNSSGEIICFTDDDCVADKNWITELLKGFDKESVGGVGGNVKAEWLSNVYDRYAEDAGLLSQEKFKSMNFLIGCNSAYRKAVLEKIGYYDVFLNACEDLDLSIKTQLSGYTLNYVPEAIIYHIHRASLKGLFSQQYRNGIGFIRLHKKYAQDFNPGYNVVLLSYRLIYALVKYPFRVVYALSSKDRRYYLVKPVLNMVVTYANLLGILREIFFGRKYDGNVVSQKIPFIENQSMRAMLRKIRSKMA
jgi:cellulose synthase/poly-beta-1,6-N-acetylglucosamine synthase-like glycosyltransferase